MVYRVTPCVPFYPRGKFYRPHVHLAVSPISFLFFLYHETNLNRINTHQRTRFTESLEVFEFFRSFETFEAGSAFRDILRFQRKTELHKSRFRWKIKREANYYCNSERGALILAGAPVLFTVSAGRKLGKHSRSHEFSSGTRATELVSKYRTVRKKNTRTFDKFVNHSRLYGQETRKWNSKHYL